ncbi:MAG: M28 family metallopeptidase [Emticicia sp.]|nr:M28 family metallopeptidase [Emticicia sp.]
MKKIYLLAFSAVISFNTFSQKIINRDPQIETLINQISSDSLKKFDEKLVSFGTRSTLSTTTDSKRGIGASRLWVLSKFQEFAKTSDGRMTAVLDTFTLQPDGRRIDKTIAMANVMATLKGTDPNDDRVFMVSGHIDSRVTDVMNRESDAPGANDDGSGTVAVIELARVMAKSKFPATIIFVVVSGEEQGLLGANYLAEKALKQNWNLEALLNNDIMGSNNSNETNIIDNTRLRIFSEGLPAFEMDKKVGAIRQYGAENDGKARQLARYVKETGERYVDNLEIVMIYRNDRFLRGGDHTPFVTRGFAAVRLSEMNENFLHQHQDLRTEKGVEYGDLIKFMDFEYLRKNTCVNLASLANLAKSPSLPQDVILDVRGLGNSTNLNWKAPKTGKVKGYYILMRETAMPYWQKKFFTPNLKISLPYSKDNYFFAVQAVSEDGNEGLPVIPRVGLRNAGE